MKRKFTFLIAAMALMIAIMSPREAWGQSTTWTHTFTSGQIKTTAGTITLSGKSWTQTAATYISFDSTKGVQIGSSGSPTTSFSLSTTAFSEYTITEIKVNSSTGSKGTAKLNIAVGNSTYLSNQTLTTSATDYTCEPNTSGDVIVSWTNTAKAFYVKSISVTYVSGPTTYTVTYDANGATGGTVPTDETKYDSGDEVTVLGNTGNLVKAGFVYDGWNTKADGSGTTLQAGGTFTITSDTTLYAKWNAKTITNLAYTGTPTQTEYSVGDSFNPAGLTVTATFNDESQEDVTSQVVWTPNPLTVGTTSVTGAYMGMNVVVDGITVTGPSIVLNTTNSPFTSTSSSNQSTEQVTLSGIEFENQGGYKYNSYLSFNKNLSGAYLGNNTMLCGNIKKIVVVFSSDVSSKLTMYEGNAALSETTSITPTLSSDNKTATYTFSGNTGYFKYKLTTTGSYCNISNIEIYLDECETHTVTGVASPELGGSVSIEEATLGENQTTQVTATANSGYRFTGWAVDGAGSSLASLEDATTTFTMGTEDATITASFEEIATYDITIGAITGGTVTSDKEFAEADATVTLTAAAADGYAFNNIADNWSVTYGDNQPVAVTPVANSNTATFTMPAGAVNVSATFRPIPTNSWSASSYEAVLEGTNTFPEYSTNSDGDVTYTSSEESVATINEDGEITLLAKGTTTITASTPETATWAAGSASYTLTVVKLATIPFAFDGGVSNIASTDGMSQSGLGSDYGSSPKLKFDGTGDWVIIHYASTATSLGYKIKGNSFSGGTFDVMESENGTEYTAVKSYTTLGDAATESCSLKSESRYVKFIYTKKSSGNVALGAISIRVKQIPTNSWSATAYEATMGGENTYPEFETNSDGDVTYSSSEETVATINATTGAITLVSPGVTTITATTAETENYLSGSASYNLTVIASSVHTITYHSNGETSSEDVYAGVKQLTAPANVPNGYTYVGWATEEIDGVAESATYFSSYDVTEDVDLYAVFAIATKGGDSYRLSSTAPVDGDNVIVAGKNNDKYYALWVDGSTVTSTELTITDGIVENYENLVWSASYDDYNGTYGIVLNNGTNPLHINSGALKVASGNSNGTFEFPVSGDGFLIYGNQNTRWMTFNGSTFGVTSSEGSASTLYFFMPVTFSNFCTSVNALSGTLTSSSTEANKAYYISETSTVEGEVTINGVLGNADASLLIINDGAQLILNNAGVKATAKKKLKDSGESKASDWYSISSPLAANTAFANVANLIPTAVTETDYDLYRLNEAEGKWENSRIYANDGETVIANPTFTTIDKGCGYIYANTLTSNDIAFAGEINVADVEMNVTMTADKGKGYNLLGNPFTQNINFTDIEAEEGLLAEGFYILSNSNTWGTKLTDAAIAPLQGFLVQATDNGDVTINKPTATAPGKGERPEQNANIEIVVSNSNYSDNAYAMFGDGIGLNKISHRNAEAQMVYIPQNDEKFAIAMMDESVTLFPVSFKAMTTGYYTISLKSSQIYEGYNDFDYLHLIDNMTGEEIDMLLEDGYKFVGSPRDNESRFTVKLHRNGVEENEVEDVNFVYQNGNSLVISGEGTFELIDMLGRVVISKEIHGETVNVDNLITGAYIVRMIGNEVKTQKIVIR